jgi:hypothetical protein
MKKISLLVALALFLSCNESKPIYSKCIEIGYNFNKEAANEIMSVDTLNGTFNVEISSELVKITDQNGKENVLKNNDTGFLVTNKMVGDTLVIQYFPTAKTPSNVLKFGSEYKFYN